MTGLVLHLLLLVLMVMLGLLLLLLGLLLGLLTRNLLLCLSKQRSQSSTSSKRIKSRVHVDRGCAVVLLLLGLGLLRLLRLLRPRGTRQQASQIRIYLRYLLLLLVRYLLGGLLHWLLLLLLQSRYESLETCRIK